MMALARFVDEFDVSAEGKGGNSRKSSCLPPKEFGR